MQIDGITIENFKNVVKGDLSFDNPRRPEGASMLALYGQNGSGKTALIDSLVVLRNLVQGRPIPEAFGSYVTTGKDHSEIEYRFHRRNENAGRTFKITYRILFSGDRDPREWQKNPLLMTCLNKLDDPYRCPLISETLSFGFESDDGSKKRMSIAARVDLGNGVATRGFREFLTDLVENPRPKAKRQKANGGRYRRENGELSYEQHAAGELVSDPGAPLFDFEIDFGKKLGSGMSFLFSDKVCQAVSTYCEDDDFRFVHEAVQEIAWKLGITGTKEAGMLTNNQLPLYSQPFDEHTSVMELDASGTPNENTSFVNAPEEYGIKPIVIDLQMGPDPGEEYTIGELEMRKLKRIEPGLNAILSAIVPGLNIEFAGTQGYDGDPEPSIQVFSVRDESKIPLACESHGIKRLVSIVMLLVNAFNDPDFVAVVDEIDAGIFEFLLGEILEIIQDEGRGQLIFTSHNLHPLEKLDKGFVAFTTTDPENRYTRLKNVKTTNNLRDVYLRCLLLGGNNGELYNAEDSIALADAFFDAGRFGDYSVGKR